MKNVMVDIDNTLYPFSTQLYEELKKINENLKSPTYWDKWKFYKDYNISSKEFYATVDKCHMNMKLEPYNGTFHILNLLKEKGYNIIISSHRNNNVTILTELQGWLEKYHLSYNEISLSKDKTKEFKRGIDLIIDDSPKVLAKAKESNINYTGLRFGWNQEFHKELYHKLSDIYWYVFYNY